MVLRKCANASKKLCQCYGSKKVYQWGRSPDDSLSLSLFFVLSQGRRLQDHFINTETVEETRRSGRPRMTYLQLDPYIVIIIPKDRTVTANAIRVHL